MELGSVVDSTAESVIDHNSSDGLPQYSTLQSERSSDLIYTSNGIVGEPIENNFKSDHKMNGLESNEIYLRQENEQTSATKSGCCRNFFRISHSRHSERKQRIRSILKSINSVSTNVPEYSADDSYHCRINRNVVEYILLVIGILLVTVACLSPAPVYYTAAMPPKPSQFRAQSDAIKSCQLHLFTCDNHMSDACGIDGKFSQLSPLLKMNATVIESNLTSIFTISFDNQSCLDSVKEFFCNASYRSCDDESVFAPSVDQCEKVQNVCVNDWDKIQRVSPVLSDCDLYAPRNITCPDQFELFCDSYCLPLCSEFSQNSGALTIVLMSVIGTSVFFVFITGVFVFIVAFFKRESTFHFPNIIILYITGLTMVYAILQIIPLLGGKNSIDYFFCSHKTLLVSFVEATAYCSLYGIDFQSGLVAFSVLWVLFIIHLFIKVVFPVTSQNILKYHGTKIHIAEVLLTVVACSIPPAVSFSTDGYFISSFPPTQCYSNVSVLFHGAILPSMLISIFGISLILITILSVHRTTGLFKKTGKGSCQLSVPEVKLMIISIYLTVFLAIGWVVFTVGTHNDGIFESIMAYSQCVIDGENRECDHLKEDYKRMSMPFAILTITFYLSLMMLNVMSLLFIIQAKDVKMLARRVTQSFISSTNDL